MTVAAPERAPSFLRRVLLRPEAPAAATLILLVLVFGLSDPESFATVNQLRTLALNAAVLLIVGIGVTFVLIAGGFDLSAGSVLVFGGVVTALVLPALGSEWWSVPLAVLIAAAAGAVWGAVNGILIGRFSLPPFVVTLATLGAALGAAQLVSGGGDLLVGSPEARAFGLGRTFEVPNLVWVAALVAVAAWIVLAWTRFGRWTRALGSNPAAARLSGIPVFRHTTAVYVLSGALAGLAGALSAFRFGTTSLGGFSDLTMQTITIAVLGGTSLYGGRGTILGTAIAALVPVTLSSGLVILGVAPYWQPIVVGAVLVAAIYLDRLRTRTAGSRT
jgi:ribose transport system permease protein